MSHSGEEVQILTTPTNYIWPPRAKDAVPKDATNIFGILGWIAQLKYNDSHLLIDMMIKNGEIETIGFWDRHKGILNSTTHLHTTLIPELQTIAKRAVAQSGDGRYYLDAGLLDTRHSAIKGAIVIWDMLVRAGHHETYTTYGTRYAELEKLLEVNNGGEDLHFYHMGKSFGRAFTPNIFLPDNYKSTDWDKAWELIAFINKPYPQPVLEGLVFKNSGGELKHGMQEQNNDAWMGKSRVCTGRHRF